MAANSSGGGRLILTACLCASVSGCGGDNDAGEELFADPQRLEIGNDGPEGVSGLTIDNIRYPLDVALGDIWGASGEHFRIDFTLTNGNFMLDTETVDGQAYQTLVPAEASAVFHASMFSPGGSFNYASYAYAPLNAGVQRFPGVGYFTDAYIGVDINQNNIIDNAEKMTVIDGRVDFAGTLPDIELNFSVTLSNGKSVTGEYTGLFDFTER